MPHVYYDSCGDEHEDNLVTTCNMWEEVSGLSIVLGRMAGNSTHRVVCWYAAMIQ